MSRNYNNKASFLSSLSSLFPLIIIGGIFLLFKPLSKLIKTFFGGIDSGFKSLFSATGLTDSPATTQVLTAQTNPLSPWNTEFYKKAPTGASLLTVATANSYLKEIESCWGFWNDDFPKCFGVFKKLRTQSQLSFLSYIYSKNTNKDLLTYLKGEWSILGQDRLDHNELKQIEDYILKLPKYKPN